IGLGQTAGGHVRDIDTAMLADALVAIRNAAPAAQAILSYGPDDVVEGSPLLWLTSDSRRTGQAQQVDLPDSAREKAEQLLHQAYKLRSKPRSDLHDVLGRFTEVLVTQAAHDRPDQFRRGLEVLEQLIRLRVLRPEATKLLGSGFHALPDYLGEFEYR